MATSLELTDLTKCPLCLGDYLLPRALPCLHSFCEACLAKHVEKSEGGKEGKFPCPLCQKENTLPEEGVSGFVLNYMVTNLQNVLQHDGVSLPSTPRLPGSENAAQKVVQLCERHSDCEVSLYCNDCRKCLCTNCLSESHRRHDVVTIQEVATLTREQHVRYIFDIEVKTASKDENVDRLNNYQNQLDTNMDEMTEQIERHCEKLCEQLKKMKTDLISDIKQRHAIETENVRKCREKCKYYHGRQETCLAKLRSKKADIKVVLDMVERRREVDEVLMQDVDGLEVELLWEFQNGELGPRALGHVKTKAAKGMKKSKSMFRVLEGTLRPQSRILTQTTPRPRTDPSGTSTRYLVQAPTLHSSFRCDGWVRDLAWLDDDVLVTSAGGPGRVKIYDLKGIHKANIGYSGANPVRNAAGVLILPDGDIAISDSITNNVKIYKRDGAYVSTICEGLGKPWGLTMLRNGDLAVCYPSTKSVHVFSLQDKTTSKLKATIRGTKSLRESVGGTFKKPNKFKCPQYIIANKPNNLVVSDYKANGLYNISLEGEEAYTCQVMYGSKSTGSVRAPQGVCSDSLGNVLVAECKTDRVLLLLLSSEGRFLQEQEILTNKNDVKTLTALAVRGNLLAVGQDDGYVKIYKYK